jgi:hypothetical protein
MAGHSALCGFILPCMESTNGDHDRSDIERLEAQIDELEATIESCRKFVLAGRIAVAGGAVILIVMLIGALRFDPAVIGIAAAAVLGGIVAAGSNRSTAKEASGQLSVVEAKRLSLIGQLDLRIVRDLDH